MRAAVFRTDTRRLSIEQLPDPTPSAGQVVIKVHRCGICGSDLHMAEDHAFNFADGAVPGHEVAGEVVALGKGANGLKIGDRVSVLPFLTCGQCPACLAGDALGCPQWGMFGAFGLAGGYAEYALTNPNWCVRLPSSLGFEDGALVEPLAVSLRAARAAKVQPGDKVLVLGAGAIGLAAAYWARRYGATRVAVSATSRRREAVAMQVGADVFLVPEDGRSKAEQCMEALGGLPDVVFECAGFPGSLDQAVSAVRRGGTIAAPGFCWTPDSFNTMAAMIKEVSIRYTNMYGPREFEICTEALDRGFIEPRAMITKVVSLADAPDAFAELQGRNQQCKVMIKPW